MRLVRNAIAASLCAGLALAGTARAGGGNPRVNGDIIVEDDLDPDNEAVVEANDTTFSVSGAVFGVGTAGDDVSISFDTPLPDSANANDKSAKVKQGKFSTLNFSIESDDAGRDLDLTINPEKCSVQGNANVNNGKGNVTVNCSGTNIYSGITADQEASITAAFQENKRVKFKVNNDGSKGSLKITIKGEAFFD
jgi:hypothetical protein